MRVEKYFGGYEEFTIEGHDKNDALENAKCHMKHNHKFDNCKCETIEVVKKMKI